MKKGLLIDKNRRRCKVVEFEDNLKTLYKLLDCDCITITSRKIGDAYYEIVCDDEGLLKENIITAFDKNQEPALVGNLLIMNHDDCGELLSLEDSDIKNIKKYVKSCISLLTGTIHCVLTELDY